MATTSRLSLRYPVASDTADVPRDIGNLASDIDKAAIFAKGTFASRPTSTVGSPGIDGRYYFATDTSRLYLDTGTSWVEVASGTDSVTSAMIAADAVDSSEIKDSAVTSAKILDGTIASGDLADSAVATAKIAANAVTAPKIDATVAGYLGLTSGATTRRWTVSAATERTTTSVNAVDVTGASVSVDDVQGNLMAFVVTYEAKSSNASGYTPVRITTNAVLSDILGVAVTDFSAVTVSAGSSSSVKGTSYVKSSLFGFYTAPATQTTTVKAQFNTNNVSYTASIKNVVINVWAITP